MILNKLKIMNKKLLPALILLLLFISALNCGKQDTQITTDKQEEYKLPPVDTAGALTGDWILQRELADPQSLNPITLQDATGREFSYYIFERLMWAADRTSYDVIPWLADSLPQVSEDHLTYIFKLKKNITFSNGKPLTGDDIIFTFKALMNPLVDAAQLRNYVENVKTVELVGGDKYTIKFSLSKPYFRSVIAISDIQILSKEVVDPEGLTDKYTWEDCRNIESAKKNPVMMKFADFFNSEDMNRNPKYLIGSGPYVFEKWETGQFVHFKRNPNYWNRNGEFGMVYPDKLVIRVIQDQSAAVVAAKNKEIDLMYVVKPADFVKELANAEQYNMKKADPYEPVFSYIGWNMKSPLFSDKKVRMALAYAVDRKTIIDRIHFGLAVPIQSPVYFEDKKHFKPDLPEIPFDLEKAKQLLKEAGWEDSNGDGILDKNINGNRTDFKFFFLSNTNVARRQALLVITDALKKIGIISDVQDLEWSVFLQKLKKHEFDAFMGAWVITDYPPDEYQLFHSSQMKSEGSNYTSYSNPEADKLMEDYRVEFDENKRIEIIKKLQKIFYDDQVYTFLWTPNAKYVYSDRYKNVRWYPTPITAYQTSEWWVPVNSRKYQSAN
jgi:peptide/nickel transport system substrate-binding protein